MLSNLRAEVTTCLSTLPANVHGPHYQMNTSCHYLQTIQSEAAIRHTNKFLLLVITCSFLGNNHLGAM